MRRFFRRFGEREDRPAQPQSQSQPAAEAPLATAPQLFANPPLSQALGMSSGYGPGQLCEAASKGSLGLARLLLDAGVPVNGRNSKDYTPLHLAVQQGHEPVVRLLLSRGALVSAVGPGSLQPLHIAIATQDARLARLLLTHGADIEAAPTGATPFHLAVSTGSEELVDLLLEMGANPRALITNEAGRGETALHAAVATWKDELLPKLLAVGLDVNAAGANPAGQTALHIAAWYGYESAARTLLSAGADTALHGAAEHDQVNMCELLLEHGADIMAATPKGDTALCMAALHGKIRTARLLLDKSIHSMTQDQKMRVLISAAGTGRRDVTKLLLDGGFDPNMTDLGLSALDVAAMYSHENVIVLLLEAGANPGVYSLHDRHSADLAGEKDHDRIVGLLRGTIPLPKQNSSSASRPDFVDATSAAWMLSASMTHSSRRRIMANPNPGGFPMQCHVCLDLDFRRGVPKDAEVVHWAVDGAVADMASRGCPGCDMIKKCLEHLATVYGESLAAWTTVNKSCQLLSTVHGGPLYVVCGDGLLASQPTVRAEIYSQPGFPVTWPVVGKARDVPAAPWSGQRLALIRRFLDECLTKHTTCSYKDGALPTRVIDVGSSTTNPHLHIPAQGEVGRYVTLSHCWGGSSPVTTTRSTLDDRRRGIPLATLPKTFRDAVLIARDLGVRYLWIDSLCIVQDSTEDWERESLKMSTIYEAGYAMIAAQDSENCHGGCFPPGGNQVQTFSLGVEGPAGRNSKVHFRLTNLLSDDKGEVCHRLYSTRNGFRRSALDKRGWTLQERLLAPRTLHFGRAEVGWECAAKRACECQTVPTQTDTDSRFKAQLVNFDAGGLGAYDKRWLWSNIIKEFTRRSLTSYRDLLPALSGLAARMSATAADDYVCGMWKDKFQAFLPWKPDYRYIRDNALAGLPRRHDGGFYAPSWSWASLIAPIEYGGLGEGSLRDSMWKRPYPINKGEAGWQQKQEGNGRVEQLQVLDIRMVRAGINPFGPLESASLMLRAAIADAIFQGKTKDRPLQGSANGGLLLGADRDGGASSLVPPRADFEPDVPDERAEAFVGDRLCLLFMSESETAEKGIRTSPRGGLEGFGPFGTGIVLKEAAVLVGTGTGGGSNKSQYSRVGTFRFQEAADWTGWRSLRTERIVLLV